MASSSLSLVETNRALMTSWISSVESCLPINRTELLARNISSEEVDDICAHWAEQQAELQKLTADKIDTMVQSGYEQYLKKVGELLSSQSEFSNGFDCYPDPKAPKTVRLIIWLNPTLSSSPLGGDHLEPSPAKSWVSLSCPAQAATIPSVIQALNAAAAKHFKDNIWRNPLPWSVIVRLTVEAPDQKLQAFKESEISVEGSTSSLYHGSHPFK